MGRIVRIFFAGLLALLPILVTVIVTVWVAQLIHAYAGPDSLIGKLIVLLGLNLVSSATAAYLLGFLIILASIFALGLIVESRLRPLVQGGLDWLMMRIPLVSNVYDLRLSESWPLTFLFGDALTMPSSNGAQKLAISG